MSQDASTQELTRSARQDGVDSSELSRSTSDPNEADALSSLRSLSMRDELLLVRNVYFGFDAAEPPLYCFQVQFPRIEIVLSGIYRNEVCNAAGAIFTVELKERDCLFVPANSWNRPIWDSDVVVLTLLFGKRQFGLSKCTWDTRKQTFLNVVKDSRPLPAQSPLHAITRSLAELQNDDHTATLCSRLLLQSVIEYTLILMRAHVEAGVSHSKYLFQNICIYIQENFHKQISRDSVASRFHISPNYLSKLFAAHGKLGFSEYLVHVRVERAKFMLKKYPFHVDEVATRCGFNETNYFCRVFKRHVGRTPTEYRVGQ